MATRIAGRAIRTSLAGPSRYVTIAHPQRTISSSVSRFRQNDRRHGALSDFTPVSSQSPDQAVPQGHVRGPRATRPSRPSHSSDPHAAGGAGTQRSTPAQGYIPDFEPPDAYAHADPPIPSRPVFIPPDPSGVLSDNHAARVLLEHDALVVVRQLEMLNVFMGYEQANRYAIHTPTGELVGFLAEEEQSFLGVLSRQALRTHRPFKATILDKTGQPILWIRRPFQFINSRIFVHAAEGQESKLVGEAQQEWHPWRRRYNVFQAKNEENFRQFAKIDSGFLAWDFWLKDRDDRLVASINRNFRGIGRELFTDTGQYVIRFDSAGTELDLPPGAGVTVQGQSLILPEGGEGGLTLDQRAMTLATAVSIDFDYFSRHSGSGGFGLPFFIWGSDGSSEANSDGSGAPAPPSDLPGGAAAGAAGAAGAYGSPSGLSEDEQIYGPQPTRPTQPGASGEHFPPGGTPSPGGAVGGGTAEEGWGWNESGEEVMQDPYAQEGQEDEGWFGGWGGGEGGGGGGGDGGSWGDWGN